jgi:DnaK suppressor protein
MPITTTKTPAASTKTSKVTTKAAVVIDTKAKPKLANKVKEAIPTLEALSAMPESEYMTAPQLRYFKAVLEGMRADILINSDATSEHLRENVVVPDPADRATIEEEHAIELRTRDRERKLLKKITQALEAIEQGEYGWCEETGDAIGLRRLLARPTATLSLEAQQRRELRQKMYGD